jgi:hypothetical protein
LAPTEAQLHQSVAEYLDWVLLPPAVYSTFPAGWGKLGKAMAGQLKASGLKPGMPDIFVFYRHEVKLGDYRFPKIIGVELKRPGEKPSAAQQLMFPRLRELGIPIYVCECVDDVHRAMCKERIPLRTIRWHDEQLERRKRQLDEISAKLVDTGDGDGTETGTPGRVAQS